MKLPAVTPPRHANISEAQADRVRPPLLMRVRVADGSHRVLHHVPDSVRTARNRQRKKERKKKRKKQTSLLAKLDSNAYYWPHYDVEVKIPHSSVTRSRCKLVRISVRKRGGDHIVSVAFSNHQVVHALQVQAEDTAQGCGCDDLVSHARHVCDVGAVTLCI
jgi:hypothetical protein